WPPWASSSPAGTSPLSSRPSSSPSPGAPRQSSSSSSRAIGSPSSRRSSFSGRCPSWQRSRPSGRGGAGRRSDSPSSSWLPRPSRFAPRLDLVHYNRARLAEDRGRPEEAAAHYREALANNPEDFLSYLNLGNLAARSGNLPAALELYEKAAALEPRSDDAQS